MSKARGELFRDPQKGKIAGVCAGLAQYFGWEVWLVRILVVSGVLFGMGWFILLYIAGWFILDKKPSHLAAHGNAKNFVDDDVINESIKVKAKVWQAGETPKQAVRDICHKFNSLEQELQAIERYVTSSQYTVSREINRL
ncbi:envelope stress response membrane protein PspC [Thalassotalea ponticola]|uniref:envelope stress response membrane protein PspC n=1 Tax=Thalassotalea ponticola TaxID=1523392 RepID=UPI0025B332B7|nr:envelope stress response membrane protein PspC [Thalassotalea ponticola]MDN3653173.1 envelope stress response membrane protein PspC [Thalassotalea ponticola]